MVFLAGTDETQGQEVCSCAVSSPSAPTQLSAPNFWPRQIPAPKSALGWAALGAVTAVILGKVFG